MLARVLFARAFDMDYFTIKNVATASFKEKKSEFIGNITHCESNDGAIEFIEKIRGNHRKAAHNPYAYILKNGNISRYSDDGEPQGTAGAPIIDALAKNKLTDVCCVVTRYFGGILLGGGGLIRAYSQGAVLALQSAGLAHMRECVKYNVKLAYNEYGKLKFFSRSEDFRIIAERFTEIAEIDLITVDCAFEKKVTELTNGKAVITEIGKGYFEFA